MFFPIVAIRTVHKELDEALDDHEIFRNCIPLDLVKAHPRLTIDKDKLEELAEGTHNVASEKVDFETATFRVTLPYLTMLRELLESVPVVDFLLADVTCTKSIIYDLRGMRPHIAILAQDDDSAIIKLTAGYIRSTCDDSIPIVEHKVADSWGIILGTVVDEKGDPIQGVIVSADKPTAASLITNTWADGSFILYYNGGIEVKVTCQNSSYSFPTTRVEAAPNQVFPLTIVGSFTEAP